MISFIIIGKNVINTIELCIHSVRSFTNSNNISNYEILYVDSDSSDGSVSVSLRLNVKVIIISGHVNAAIARNVGAQFAKGSIFFFIDGDMELTSDFYNYIFDNRTNELIYPRVSGLIHDKFYDKDFSFKYMNLANLTLDTHFRPFSGGLMIIERSLWELNKGMDERLIRNQDLDFGLRSTNKGFPILIVNKLFAIHHTISYFDKKRMKDFFLSKALLSPGILMRKHLFNLVYIKFFHKDIIYVLFLISTLISIIFSPFMSLFFIVIYFILHFARSVRNKEIDTPIYLSWLYKVLYSVYTMIGLMFYFPKKKRFTMHEVSTK